MTLLAKSATALVIAGGLFVVGVRCAYWWANIPPSRPTSVPGDAVFLWAPYVGVPSPKRGNWLNCWEDATGRNQCRLARQDGATVYQGEFIPYRQTSAVAASQLRIDPDKSRERRLWVGGELVPLVYLNNGRILIPAAKYEEGTKLLDRLKSNP